MSAICCEVGTLTSLIAQFWMTSCAKRASIVLDIYVLGTFPSADDDVAPFNARGVVLLYRGRLLLLES